jgi:hypothetical protein
MCVNIYAIGTITGHCTSKFTSFEIEDEANSITKEESGKKVVFEVVYRIMHIIMYMHIYPLDSCIYICRLI